MSTADIPGIQYPAITGLVDPKVEEAIKVAYDNLFYLKRLAESPINLPPLQPGNLTQQVANLAQQIINNNQFTGTGLIITDTHFTRINQVIPALGTGFFEIDRGSFYVVVGSAAGIGARSKWKFTAGLMIATIAQRPTDLGLDDAGFTFFASDQATAYVWTGSSWVTSGGIQQIVSDAATNTPSTILELIHLTSAAAATNFAARQDIQLQNAAGAQVEAGAIDCLWDVPTGGNEGSRFRFLLRRAGAALVSCLEFNKALLLTTGTIFWQAGTAFTGQLFHANTAARTYTFPDIDMNVAASGLVGAHTIVIPKRTGGGTDGSITWNSDGCVTAFTDPT